MAVDGKVMRRALNRFEADKQRRSDEYAARRARIYAKIPEVMAIDRELAGTMRQIIAQALRQGQDPSEAVARIRDRNLSLQEEKRRLLMSRGYEADYLDETPACPLCGDSGYQDGRMCRCLRAYYVEEQNRELSRLLDLGSQSFDTFSLDWYDQNIWPEMGRSPRAHMETVYETCVHYARSFGKKSGSLLMTGAPGLGKTFLSACIAREVSGRGFSVVYDTAQSVFVRFEDEKFGREEGDEVRRVLNCDLLILDDLGTEMTTSFVQSALYQIVNTRLMTEKSTIVNTNLTPDELRRRYTPQIASRMEGEYEVLVFFGEDIRRLKKERQ